MGIRKRLLHHFPPARRATTMRCLLSSSSAAVVVGLGRYYSRAAMLRGTAAAAAAGGVGGAASSSSSLAPVALGSALRHMSAFGGGAGFKGMEGFFKQEKLRGKVEEALNAKAKAEQYLAKKNVDEAAAEAGDGMPPPPWEAPPPPVGVQAMAWRQTSTL